MLLCPNPMEKVYTGTGIGSLVTATSDKGTDYQKTSDSAAIGNGRYYAYDGLVSKQPASTITLNCGTAIANDIDNCTGIGSGECVPINHVNITDGNIKAISEHGTGIGSGDMGDSRTVCITGGTIYAESESGCGIGGGYTEDI